MGVRFYLNKTETKGPTRALARVFVQVQESMAPQAKKTRPSAAAGLLPCFLSFSLLPPHRPLHLFGSMRQILCDLYQIPFLVNVVNVLDAHSKFFFRNINPGLDRKHHSFVE